MGPSVPNEQKSVEAYQNQMTLYLFPIRNGSTEYNREFNKKLGGICEEYRNRESNDT